MSRGGSHLLLITSLGPAPPPGHALPADDSAEQLQFVCELLIPRGEVVMVPGNQHISLSAAAPGGEVQTGRVPVGLPSPTLCRHSDGCGVTGGSVVLGPVALYVRVSSVA